MSSFQRRETRASVRFLQGPQLQRTSRESIHPEQSLDSRPGNTHSPTTSTPTRTQPWTDSGCCSVHWGASSKPPGRHKGLQILIILQEKQAKNGVLFVFLNEESTAVSARLSPAKQLILMNCFPLFPSSSPNTSGKKDPRTYGPWRTEEGLQTPTW